MVRRKRRLQEAADSGALTGAFEVRSDSSFSASDLKSPVENAVLKSHQRVATGTPSEVRINYPPLNGEFTADPVAVEVIIDRNHETYFLDVLGKAFSTIPINVRAVATQNGAGGVADACILALGTGGCPAISVNGNAEMNLTNCSMHANGQCDPGVEIGNNSEVVADCITSNTGLGDKLVENYDGPIADYVPGSNNVYMDCGVIDKPAGNIDDPFAGLTFTPPTGGCNTFAYLDKQHWLIDFAEMLDPIGEARAHHKAGHNSTTGTTTTTTTSGGGTPTQIGPGYYCGGVINGDFELTPGVYFFESNITFHGEISSQDIAGADNDGVIIITVDPSDASATIDIDINGNAVTPLSAPSRAFIEANDDPGGLFDGLGGVVKAGTADELTGAGAWGGMLYYGANPAGNSCSAFNGTSELAFSGAVYQPDGCVRFNGNTDAAGTGCFMLVAEEVIVSGTTGMEISSCGADFGLPGGSFGASGVQSVGLVE